MRIDWPETCVLLIRLHARRSSARGRAAAHAPQARDFPRGPGGERWREAMQILLIGSRGSMRDDLHELLTSLGVLRVHSVRRPLREGRGGGNAWSASRQSMP